jgi:hypothetical protein
MAIDQRDVSSTLRFMDDRALQQYAAMHKNDPYIFPLAFQESQNRQRLRMSQQGAQGMQPQPKVADQALAQMASQPLPEDVGIGALPAPNMTMAAEGGIMGYEGYDEGPSDFGQGPVMMMSGGGVARYNGTQGSAVSLNAIENKYQKELQEINTGARVQYSPDVQEYVNARAQTSPDSTPVQVNPIPNAPPQAPARPPLGSSLSIEQILKKAPSQRTPEDNASLESAGYKLQRRVIPQGSAVNVANTALTNFGPSLRSTLTAGASQLTDEELAKKPAVGGALSERILRGLGISPTPLQMESAAGQNMTAQAPTAAQQRDALSENQAAAAVDASRLRDGRKDTGRKDTGRKDTGRKDTERKDTAEKDVDVQGMFKTALKEADAKPNPYETQLKAINQSKVKAAEENVTGLDAIQKQFADIYKGRKERLDTREGEIAKMKDQSLGLALLNAGARMMQTRGSIGEAIGAGIDTGSKQYVAGLDKINAAKDKLSDARDRLEEIEAQRGELSARELHKARNEVKSLTTAGMENLIQAAMAERKINRAEAIAFVEQQIKVSEGSKDRASREGIARLQADTANRPGAEIQAVERIMAEKKIPFTEALALYNSNRREPQTAEMLLKAWTGNVLLQQQYPNPQDYVKMMSGSAGGASQLSPADKALVEKYSR